MSEGEWMGINKMIFKTFPKQQYTISILSILAYREKKNKIQHK